MPKFPTFIIILLAVSAIVVGAVGVAMHFTNFDNTEPIPVVTEEWVTYRNEKYGFEIEHPKNWQVAIDENIPGVHFFKQGESKPDNLTHHSAFTHVSIYPEGIGTEGVQGENASSTIAYAVPIRNAVDYTLKDGAKWATYANVNTTASNWQQWGFLWAGVKVENEKIQCQENDGTVISESNCDFGVEFANTKTVRTGTISSEDRKIQEKMLASFKFTTSSNTTQAETKTYTSSNYKFSLQYPKDFVVKQDYFFSLTQDLGFDGVSFSLPESELTGTNLKEAFIAIEENPDNSSCTAPEFLNDGTKPFFEDKNGITYSVALSGDAAAGNFYEQKVYATSQNGRCYGVRYFLHSTNVGNFPEGTVKEFDKTKVLAIFDQVLSTLKFTK